MGRCGCSKQACSCVIDTGAGLSHSGAGSPEDPLVISLDAAQPGGGTGFAPGDIKETASPAAQAGWLECDGSAVSRSSYPDLFAAIGTLYGPGNSSTTFNLPDYRGRFRPGAGAAGFDLGTAGGAATSQLTEANLPAHTHPMGHVHPIDHNHASFNTAAGGRHDHNGNLKITTDGLPNHTHNAPKDGGQTSGAGSTNSGKSVARGAADGTDVTGPLTWNANGGEHAHAVDVPAYTGSSGAASTPTTGSVGSGAAFSNLPPYRATRVLIKT